MRGIRDNDRHKAFYAPKRDTMCMVDMTGTVPIVTLQLKFHRMYDGLALLKCNINCPKVAHTPQTKQQRTKTLPMRNKKKVFVENRARWTFFVKRVACSLRP